ncbi:MAG: CpsD/CapB family tyrosine-protein kinase [Pirellulales bacterium]|nr:CpsD/CapB family tyrosine-protein kinase [Pirellulales bacterium]
MGQLLDALKRLETPGPRAVEPETVSDTVTIAPEEEPALRGEVQMADTLREVESAVTELTVGELPEMEIEQAFPAPVSPPPLPPQPSPAEKSPQGEVFSEIARSLCGQLPTGQATALFFTSPQDGEGKTETLWGLVHALAAQGTGRTLVVDANFRRPTFSRRWAQVRRGHGLGEVLWAMADWDEAVQSGIVRGVDLLPNFGLPRNLDRSAEPLGFDDLLQAVRKEYSLVLIDAASLAHAETAVLAATCEGVYLVVRFGYTTRPAVRTAVDALTRSGSRLWGCIGVEG